MGEKMNIDNKKRLTITLTQDQLELLERESKETGVSKSAIVSIAVRDWVSRNRVGK